MTDYATLDSTAEDAAQFVTGEQNLYNLRLRRDALDANPTIPAEQREQMAGDLNTQIAEQEAVLEVLRERGAETNAVASVTPQPPDEATPPQPE